MSEPSWLTPPHLNSHGRDREAQDLPEHQYGRGMVLHAHVIVDDWPVEQKQQAGDHIDRHHGGTVIAPIIGER